MKEEKRKNGWVWVLLAILLIAVLWYFLKPFGSKTEEIPSMGTSTASTTLETGAEINTLMQNATEVKVDANTQMTLEQKAAIASAGVDINSLPTTLTVAQQICVVNKIGYTRSIQLVNGAVPTQAEIETMKVCLE